MQILSTIKDKLLERSVETVVAAFVVLIGWIGTQISPIILPALDQLPKSVFLGLLVASVTLNIFFGIIIWIIASSEKTGFKLKYGIYWDKNKNPHCPNCKIPIGSYAYYQTAGWGYYCKPCGKVFKVTDASGNDVKPEQVLKEL